jgi:HlyD family secretion protein
MADIMKKWIRVVLTLVVVGGLAAGGWWFYQNRIARPVSAGSESLTQAVDVQRGDLSASISVVGELYAAQQEDLTFDRLDDTTALLTMDTGSGYVVQEGDVLATIDTTGYEQALEEAQSDLQEAEETLDELHTPASDLELARADLKIAQAELRLAQAEEDLADLLAADLGDLEDALDDAQDQLAQAVLQQKLAGYDSLAQSERELLYNVDWHERRSNELQQLVSAGQANLEQTEELAEEQQDLADALADLAELQAKRALSAQVAEAEVATAAAAVAEAEEALADARAGADELDLATAQLAVDEARVALESAREDKAELEEGVDAVSLAAAQASVDRKRLAVAEAEEDLAAATLCAPFDGTILAAYVDVGDLVSSSRTIVTVANLEDLQVLAAVDETTIREVSEGQSATIGFDAFPGQTFKGQVLSVPLQGTLQGDVMVYQVVVSLEGAEELTLLVGMTANVEIEVGQVTDALLVPTMALVNSGGLVQVLVPGGTEPDVEAQAVPVEVGLSNGVYTEVVRGLNEGDQVLVQMDSDSSVQFGGGGMGMLGGVMRIGR